MLYLGRTLPSLLPSSDPSQTPPPPSPSDPAPDSHAGSGSSPPRQVRHTCLPRHPSSPDLASARPAAARGSRARTRPRSRRRSPGARAGRAGPTPAGMGARRVVRRVHARDRARLVRLWAGGSSCPSGHGSRAPAPSPTTALAHGAAGRRAPSSARDGRRAARRLPTLVRGDRVPCLCLLKLAGARAEGGCRRAEEGSGIAGAGGAEGWPGRRGRWMGRRRRKQSRLIRAAEMKGSEAELRGGKGLRCREVRRRLKMRLGAVNAGTVDACERSERQTGQQLCSYEWQAWSNLGLCLLPISSPAIPPGLVSLVPLSAVVHQNKHPLLDSISQHRLDWTLVGLTSGSRGWVEGGEGRIGVDCELFCRWLESSRAECVFRGRRGCGTKMFRARVVDR